MKLNFAKFNDGCAIHGDCASNEVLECVSNLLGKTETVPLIITDPPYGQILSCSWDQTDMSDDVFASWMIQWTNIWSQFLCDRGALYVWGGIGKPNFRPFFKYISELESMGVYELANLITWKKKRAYGLKHNYLFVREELAYFVKGDAKKPRTFNIPLLDEKRGYAGFNKKYPAKSEFYRRTNVWTDINEIFRGKIHAAQKQQRLIEIPIEIHTNPGEYVIDMFAGSGTTALAARKLDRRFIVVEKDEKEFEKLIENIRK